MPVRRIRGRDPVTIEVEVNTLAKKPLRQIAPENVADLFALDEKEDLPGTLRIRLKGFRERMARSVADLPNGSGIGAFVSDLAGLAAERVPASLREVLQAELDSPKRATADRAALTELLDALSETDPEVFELGAAKKIYTAPAAGRRTESNRSSKPIGTRGSGGRSASGSSGSSAKRTPRPATPVDPERQAWIRQLVLERLAAKGVQGLLEAVLMAAVVHRSRERYGDLQKPEVRKALLAMEREGLVSQSAGRWKSTAARF